MMVTGVSADAPFWWTWMLKLKAFTLSSAGVLWLKGIREGGLPSSSGPNGEVDEVRPRGSQLTHGLTEHQNYL